MIGGIGSVPTLTVKCMVADLLNYGAFPWRRPDRDMILTWLTADLV
jgi:hypothetical protein